MNTGELSEFFDDEDDYEYEEDAYSDSKKTNNLKRIQESTYKVGWLQ